MTTMSTTAARASLYRLLEQLQTGHDPVLITGKRGNAILIGEEDWRNIEETLFLLSVPGMRESILKGMREPLKRCSSRVDL